MRYYQEELMSIMSAYSCAELYDNSLIDVHRNYCKKKLRNILKGCNMSLSYIDDNLSLPEEEFYIKMMDYLLSRQKDVAKFVASGGLDEQFITSENERNEVLSGIRNTAKACVKIFSNRGGAPVMVKDAMMWNDMIFRIIDAYYTQKKSMRFLIKGENLLGNLGAFYKSIPKQNVESLFEDDMRDFVVEIVSTKNGRQEGYVPFRVQLCNNTYKVANSDGIDVPTIGVNITGINVNSGDFNSIGDFILLKGEYPKMFSLHDRNLLCNACGLDKKEPIPIVQPIGGKEVTDNVGMCAISPEKISKCYLRGIQLYDIINMAAFVWNCYYHRNELTYKNRKLARDNEKTQVSIAEEYKEQIGKTQVSKTRYIMLTDYYRYEKENNLWKGGHHASPVEHDRRSHERRIFDKKTGRLKKIVPVKGSHIKGDKTKEAVYTIRT